MLGWARWLDTWLKSELGRPYETILSAGLVISITGTLKALTDALDGGKSGHPVDIAKMGLTLVFEVALLVNQLAQLSERREARRQRKAAARNAKS